MVCFLVTRYLKSNVFFPLLLPLQEFAKLVAILQGYCLVCTNTRISCTNQTGKGYAVVVLLLRYLVEFHFCCKVSCWFFFLIFVLFSFFHFVCEALSALLVNNLAFPRTQIQRKSQNHRHQQEYIHPRKHY